ncbi:MAG: DUF4241 domain-containing protein [Oscillospiraceae bacterium]|nr:DUF4241 domain-containing protein [Oscillospiraceae bacterium]
MNTQQLEAAKKSMIDWLSHPQELGKAPYKIECSKEFDLHGLHYYVFRFKTAMLDKWKLAVCGGYEENSLEHSGHIFSDMKEYNDKTAIEDAVGIVERIRAYWMQRARQQEELENKIRANNEFRTAETVPAEAIAGQFVKNESRFYLTVGYVDLPTGNVVAADPLVYLPSLQFSPVLAQAVPRGSYPVMVSICRSGSIGLRMCTAMLKINDNPVIKYVRAESSEETAIKLKDGKMDGFPVDAGMMCFGDARTADEYRVFLDKWYQANPDGNHYDDYFAAMFAQSYNDLPAYQREGGDFIQWTNPDTGSKMVMIASGLGDGFYCSYYGYDRDEEICRIIVPMVNPDIFEK